MKILDSQGRLFGKVSILDFGAALVILLVLVGIFFFPVPSVAQVGVTTKPVEVDLIVRGLNVSDPQQLVKQGLKEGGKPILLSVINPTVRLGLNLSNSCPTVLVPQPDGSLKELPDPRANQFSTDMLLTLNGKAQITNNGPVIGNSKLKIGTPVELEGFNYNFNATVMTYEFQDDPN